MNKLTKFAFVALIFFAVSTTMQAALKHTYTNSDEWTIYDAFHKVFWDNTKRNYKADTKQPYADHRGNGFRDGDTSGCSAAIWCQAIYFDMAVNAYKRAMQDPDMKTLTKTRYKNQMTNIYAGEKAHYVNFDFDNNNINNGWFVYDDIMWWTCALARAYEASMLEGRPNETFLKEAEKSFCRVFYGSKKVGDDGSYAGTSKGFSGGMFWEWQPINNPKPHTDNSFKAACINFPTVIACCQLYNVVPKDRVAPTGDYPTYQTKVFYLEKAKEIYAWAVEHFTSAAFPGRIADGIHGGGPEYNDHVYNQATFIGASCLLYLITGEKEYLDNARLGADYVKNKMSRTATGVDPLGAAGRGARIIRFENGYEQGVYHAIFAQYMKLLVYDCEQTDYLNWIKDNIEYGFQTRDKSRNIQDADFLKTCTANDVVESYGGSALPALMLMFPAAEATGIKTIETTSNSKKKRLYTIDGRAISMVQHGLYIKDGKKFVK